MVANAGFGAPTQLDPLNTADVEETIRVNVLGVIYSVEAVLPGMLARRHGHVLAISSLAAFKGLPGESAYCASKAAVNAYMEGLRIALRPKGVVVTTVCPGFVEDADDDNELGGNALHDVGRRSRPTHRRADRPAARRGRSLPVADGAPHVPDRPPAGRARRPPRPRRARLETGREADIEPTVPEGSR